MSINYENNFRGLLHSSLFTLHFTLVLFPSTPDPSGLVAEPHKESSRKNYEVLGLYLRSEK
ncbi:hypothetical protein M9H77_16210 [Catharanthus roseus]|uniref:Uncharacterized protein n=1 Tax=Catharanthus roseus TaxID=4058 RepID=A0ACC0AZ87_CATRO|nr:hypothetical protein M9H77_16210 [Catharanthus roseus]